MTHHRDVIVINAADAALAYERAKAAGASKSELDRLEQEVARYTQRAYRYGVPAETLVAAVEERRSGRPNSAR